MAFSVSGELRIFAHGMAGASTPLPDKSVRTSITELNNFFITPGSQSLTLDIQFCEGNYGPIRSLEKTPEQILKIVEEQPGFFFNNVALLHAAHQLGVLEVPDAMVDVVERYSLQRYRADVVEPLNMAQQASVFADYLRALPMQLEKKVSNPVPTVPRHDDARFLEFCDFLRQAPVRPAGGMEAGSYSDHFSVVEVTIDPQPNCEIAYCWYNCINHQLSNGGQVIYGWSLWQFQYVYVAQHHAVWRSDEGDLIDPTPNQGATDKALFMPDNRAPFDIEELRSPPNLEWRNNGEFVWVAGSFRSNEFFIGRMDPTVEQEDRIERTRKRLAESA